MTYLSSKLTPDHIAPHPALYANFRSSGFLAWFYSGARPLRRLFANPPANPNAWIEACLWWVSQYIIPVAEPPTRNLWQTPAETLRLGEGDCEDLACLLVSMIRSDPAGANVPLTVCMGHLRRRDPNTLAWLGFRLHVWIRSDLGILDPIHSARPIHPYDTDAYHSTEEARV